MSIVLPGLTNQVHGSLLHAYVSKYSSAMRAVHTLLIMTAILSLSTSDMTDCRSGQLLSFVMSTELTIPSGNAGVISSLSRAVRFSSDRI